MILFELVESDEGVDLGDLFLHLRGIGLRHAPRDHQTPDPAGFLGLGHFEHGLDRLSLGVVDKTAGVDHDDVGLGRVGGQFDAGPLQVSEHQFAVHQVLCTAEADHPHSDRDVATGSLGAGAFLVHVFSSRRGILPDPGCLEVLENRFGSVSRCSPLAEPLPNHRQLLPLQCAAAAHQPRGLDRQTLRVPH